MRQRVGIVRILIILIALAACGTPANVETTGDKPSTDEDRGPFDFEADTLSGQTLRGETLKGKDVILWFWAPWCPICLVEGKDEVAPALAQLPDGVEFIGIAGRSDDLEEMDEFLEWTGTGGVTHVADTDGSIWEGFGVLLQPAFYFVNQDGTFSRAGSGLNTDDILNEAQILLDS